jgi:hypothetical protein
MEKFGIWRVKLPSTWMLLVFQLWTLKMIMNLWQCGRMIIHSLLQASLDKCVYNTARNWCTNWKSIFHKNAYTKENADLTLKRQANTSCTWDLLYI